MKVVGLSALRTGLLYHPGEDKYVHVYISLSSLLRMEVSYRNIAMRIVKIQCVNQVNHHRAAYMLD